MTVVWHHSRHPVLPAQGLISPMWWSDNTDDCQMTQGKKE